MLLTPQRQREDAAKLANAVAKKQARFDGVADLRDEDVRYEVMRASPVEDVWGVGGAPGRSGARTGWSPPA